MSRTVHRRHTNWRSFTVGACPPILAVAHAAISPVKILSVTMVIAIGNCARRRSFAILAGVITVTLTFASIHTVHISCFSVTRTVILLFACRWGATIVTRIELTVRCFHAIAVTAVRFVQVLCRSVPAAIVICITWRWGFAVLPTPSLHASALAPVVPVSVLGHSVTVAMLLCRAWERN